jgi:hypothetical protein
MNSGRRRWRGNTGERMKELREESPSEAGYLDSLVKPGREPKGILPKDTTQESTETDQISS